MVTTPLTLALDELAGAVDAAAQDPTTSASLAEVVHDLERVAGAPLGSTTHDPLVVLLRRFVRVHRLLLTTCAAGLDVARVHEHVLRFTRAAGTASSRRDDLVAAGRA